MRRPILTLGLGLVVLAAACGGDDRDPFLAEGTIAWSDCDTGLQCARLSVPLDHADPDGPSVELALAGRPAVDRRGRTGVLLVNPGGPGTSGIDALRSGLPLPEGALDRFDVVTWDPRGAGASTPVRCGPALGSWLTLDPQPTSEDRPSLDRGAPRVADACAARTGALLDHVATPDHVADMEAVRLATGADSVSYLGLSYGTRLGLEYLARHGDRVDTMVLDGIVPPDLDLAGLLSTQAQELEADIDALLPGGAAAAAVRGDASNGRLPGLDGPLEAVRVDRALLMAGYDPGAARRTRAGLADAVDGDGRALDEQARRYESAVDLPAYLAISCADGRGPHGEAGWDSLERRAEAGAPTVGAVVVNELRPCAFWPDEASAGVGRAAPPPATNATVLLLANVDDPITPVEWARSVSAELPSAALVEIHEQGHIALDGSACARETAGRALIAGAIPTEPVCQ